MKITLQGVGKRFGRVSVLQDISLEISDGEFFFIIGPSGCGKTTLLRLIAGFYDCDSGAILFDGQDVAGLPAHRRNTGMVFQNYALWPHMTVAQNVAFGLTVPGRRVAAEERKKRVQRVLEMVHMAEYGQAKPNRLSGGQQQRVALARALVIEPSCLLLDEPLSNLDAKLRLEMRSEIKRIVRETGITTVYVTHDQKEALSLADRCAVLNNGRLEQTGTPRKLYDAPETLFVADFIGETNLIEGEVVSAAAGSVSIKTGFGEWTVLNGSGSFRPRDRVTLSVRPEKIELAAEPVGRVNCFTGRILESTYLGEAVEHRFAIDQGPEIKVLELNPKPRSGKDKEKVYFRVAAEDAVILKKGKI